MTTLSVVETPQLGWRETLKPLTKLFTEKMDPDVSHQPDADLLHLARPFLEGIGKYFRAEVRGLENVPKGKALFIGNHNAGITFLEPFVLGYRLYESTGGKEYLRFLGHDMMVSLPVVGNLLMSFGVVRASHQNADRAFAAGEKVMVFPGGNYEAFRPYSERHKVDFGGKKGYAKLAIRNRVPIVPVLSFGGHETFFILWRGERLAKALKVDKLLRSESFPIFLGLPWGIGFGPIFHLPLPSKSIVEVGKPISTRKYKSQDCEDPELVAELDARVQAEIQKMMDRHAKDRRWPVLG